MSSQEPCCFITASLDSTFKLWRRVAFPADMVPGASLGGSSSPGGPQGPLSSAFVSLKEWSFRSLPVYACYLSNDGSLLAASHGALISLWAPAGPQLLQLLDLPAVPTRVGAPKGAPQDLRLPLRKDNNEEAEMEVDGVCPAVTAAAAAAAGMGWRDVHCKELRILENEWGLFLLVALRDRVAVFDLLRLSLVWMQTFEGTPIQRAS